MKVIVRSKKDGVVNFGTKDQAYVKPYEIKIDKSGKLWKISGSSKKLVKSIFNFKDADCFIPENATLQEVKELYPEFLAEPETYEVFY